MTEKICPECNAAFVPRNSGQVCCSDECRRKRKRRQVRESLARFRRKLSPRQQMLVNLRQRDALAPKPKIEIIERDGVIIERRGTVPAGCHAAGFIGHNA